ncbi:MAG: hypothetical protein CMP11_08300 [Zetaproteobacteria bacterium]|nr:hypothetical protein [Pseudobdellovibrionaceae bacterium]|tara:strand:- start:2697 stop:3173 length:477 start_codon:yes stop_codon:yes gene_type:complete
MSFFFDYKLEDGSSHLENKENEKTFLDGWNQIDWNTFYEFSENLTFFENEQVIKKGEKNRSLMIIVEGTLNVVLKPKGKKQITIASLSDGEIVGDQSFVDAFPRSLDVYAGKETKVIQISWENFKKFSIKEPTRAQYFLTELAKVLSCRLRTVTSFLI